MTWIKEDEELVRVLRKVKEDGGAEGGDKWVVGMRVNEDMEGRRRNRKEEDIKEGGMWREEEYRVAGEKGGGRWRLRKVW